MQLQHCVGTTTDLRSYVRAFSAPLVPIAALAVVCLVAASCAVA